jgi:hypothetical protein
VIFTTGSAWPGNVVDVEVVDVVVVDVVVDVVDDAGETRGSVVLVDVESEGVLGGGTHALTAATAAMANMAARFLELVGCT